MQILEKSSFGLRSALLRLEAGARTPSFFLFPMVHIAEPAFYEGVMRQLEKCDLILYEGISSRSVSLLGHCYQIVANSPRLGLVAQQTMKLDRLADRLVHADVSGEAFDGRWAKLGLLLRWVVKAAAPALVFYFRNFGTRESIAGHLQLDLLKSREEILRGGDVEAFDDLLVTWRDRHLINVIEQHRQKHHGESLSIAVVFGASHMRAVVRHLTKNPEPGYRVVRSEWMTVFSF
jgi:hypothetical protein